MSQAANLVFQWIFVLNSVKHKFVPVSIVKLLLKTPNESIIRDNRVNNSRKSNFDDFWSVTE